MKSLGTSGVDRYFAKFLNSFGGPEAISEDELTFLRSAFYCGFSSCLLVLDEYGELTDTSPSSVVASLVKDLTNQLPESAN